MSDFIRQLITLQFYNRVMREQNPATSSAASAAALHLELTCYLCKKAGPYQSWSFCKGDHMRVVCLDCISYRVNSCPQDGCQFEPRLNKVGNLVELRSNWCKSSLKILRLVEKVSKSIQEISLLQPNAYSSLSSVLREFATYEYELCLEDYQKFMSAYTDYIIQIASPSAKNQFTIKIQQEDQALGKTRESYLNITKLLSTKEKSSSSKEKVSELPSWNFQCGICATQIWAPHIWTYCRQLHPDFNICFGCILLLESCPICRKSIRGETIVQCQTSLSGWTKNYQKVSSCYNLAKELNQNKFSYLTNKIIFSKVQAISQNIPKNQEELFSRCIMGWASEWCKEQERHQNILQIIQVVENQYLESREIITNCLGKMIESTRKQINKKRDDGSQPKKDEKPNSKGLYAAGKRQNKFRRRSPSYISSSQGSESSYQQVLRNYSRERSRFQRLEVPSARTLHLRFPNHH